MAFGKNSRRILNIINGLMVFLGLLVVGFSTWALVDSDGVLAVTSSEIPKNAFWAALFFGLFIMGISGLGSCSTRTDSKLGFAFYIFVVFIALVAQLTAATWLGMKYGVVSKAALVEAGTDYKTVDKEVQDFETAVVTAATNNPEDWIKTQDLLSCCGYDARHLPVDTIEDNVDTGKLCTENEVLLNAQRVGIKTGVISYSSATTNLNNANNGSFFCKDKVVKKLESVSLYVGVTAGVLAFIQFVCLLAACRLACCVSKADGGYMQDWRPSTRKEGEELNATDLTGMGASSGGPVTSNAV